jgi:hypothetical protein
MFIIKQHEDSAITVLLSTRDINPLAMAVFASFHRGAR